MKSPLHQFKANGKLLFLSLPKSSSSHFVNDDLRKPTPFWTPKQWNSTSTLIFLVWCALPSAVARQNIKFLMKRRPQKTFSLFISTPRTWCVRPPPTSPTAIPCRGEEGPVPPVARSQTYLLILERQKAESESGKLQGYFGLIRYYSFLMKMGKDPINCSSSLVF